ncbi:MAG: tetratricopeptide repeat protein [Microcoleus sp. SU_5_6]|nr:tetratricopeptide repeat protein [Microcoleus sp. SU_5_6]
MFDRTQLILTGISIALTLQFIPPVAALPLEAAVQTAQTNSNDAADRIYQEAEKLYEQGTAAAFKSAIIKYEEALKLYRETGDRAKQAIALNSIGLVYSLLGEQQKALAYLNQSLPLSQAAGDRKQVASTISNFGFVYLKLGEKQKALEYFKQSLPLARAAGDRSGEAITLTNIGNTYSDLGEKQQALEYYRQSLPLTRAVGDRRGEAITLNNIGKVYSDLGEPQTALEHYNRSLSLSRELGDRTQEATTLNNIAVVYLTLGETQKALEYFDRSLPLSRAVGNRSNEAVTLSNIGKIYSDLGEKQQALEYYQQSLSLSQTAGDRSIQANILINLGAAYSELGEIEKALEYYHQSLHFSRAAGDRIGEATTLSNMGRIYDDAGNRQEALKYFDRALFLKRATGDRSGEATILKNIGLAYLKLGEKQQALEYFSQSLVLSRAVGNPGIEAVTLFGMAAAKRDLGKLNEAIKDIEASIKIIENLRTKIASNELRTSYFSTVQDYYEFYIDLLMQLHKTQPKSGYDAKALAASERSRARSLLELLKEAKTNIREGISSDLLHQEQQLQQQLDDIEKRRIELVSSSTPNQDAVENLDKKRLELLQKYQQNQTQIRSTSPRYASLTQPQPLALREIQKQILDKNTVLLEYSLGEKQSYLWVVTTTEITSYELPKRADIETAARNFRDTVTNPRYRDLPKRVAEASANLSELILQPAAAQLGNKRLLIVPDGVLHYTPFAALSLPKAAQPNANNFLIFQHEIITLPSASTLAILRQNYADRKPPTQTLAILADPVFSLDDERIKGKITQTTTEKLESNNLGLSRSLRTSDLGWPPARLPFTRQEAQTILGLLPPVSSSQKFDFDASRTTATDGSLANYQIVHFATHGIANSQNPELSGILMSMVDDKGNLVNGFLRLTDIFNLKLAANLVVLSACQTGLGQNIQGEGMVGLTRGFMYAGAQRVGVSLWNVDDEGTSVLMQKFYQKMLQEKLAPAAALRAAQMELMSQEKWRSPYYWAAFTLQGEWK